MIFVSVEAGLWNNSFTKEMYDEYNGQHWTSQDVEDILSHIPDGGLDLDAEAFVRAFSFSAGRFALSIGGNVGAYSRVDKNVLKLGLEGNALNETYGFDNTDGEGVGVGVVGLSWGQPVRVSFADAAAVGVTVRILYGVGYGTLDRADFSLTTASYGTDVSGDYEVTYGMGGLGWGGDFGAAVQFGEKWTVSLGLSNVFGSIPWSKDVQKEVGYVNGDSLDVFDFEEDVADSSWTVEGGEFSTKLPILLRMGCAFEEGPVILTADYVQGFRDGPLSSTSPRFAVGTEWSGLAWLPLRMGVVLGGSMGFGTSFGLGIRPGGFVLDIGVMNRGFVLPQNSKGLIVAVEMGMELHRKESEVVNIGDF